MPIASTIDALPRLPAIATPGSTTTSSFIGTTCCMLMPGQRVNIALRIWTVVGPGLPTITAIHQATKFDANQ
jgi:hypothetical protein